MKAMTRIGLVSILVGLVLVLSFPDLTGADGGGANVIRGDECTISLFEVGGTEVTTTDTQSVETPSGNVSLVCRADLPDGLEPPPRALRTTGELCETALGPTTDTEKVITPAGRVRLTCCVNGKPLPTSGWAIGQDATWKNPVIVHTSEGGQTWQVQGDWTAWTGRSGNDISAVDDRTAWAALSSAGDEEAGGAILHTTDGGATWSVVPHPTVDIYQVNRMDAIGKNIWIADCWVDVDDPVGAVVHTQDGDLTWRAEHLPGDSALTVHAFSPEAVWASGSKIPVGNPSFYRTVDGGAQWGHVIQVGLADHLDDVCAASPDDVWGALNGNEAHGRIFRVHVEPDGTPDVKQVTPDEMYTSAEGVTCLDTRVAWVVGQQNYPEPEKPLGVILHTTDGGETWVQQSAPTDIYYWKISFAGARR